MTLFVRKLKHIMNVCSNTKEGLSMTEYRHKSMEEVIHFFEPEQGVIHGEDEDVDERSDQSLMDYLEISNQQKEIIS